MNDETVDRQARSKVGAIAKVTLIALTGWLAILGTLVPSARDLGGETSPWVKVAHACRAYDVAIGTPLGTLRFAVARPAAGRVYMRGARIAASLPCRV